MNQEFWKKAWEDRNIGFHNDEFHPKLVQFFPHLELKKGDRVLVPLCGKSRDLLWLKNKGFKVFGVELSQIAVEEFFSETHIEFNKEKYKSYLKYTSLDEELTIYCGDFFQIEKSDVGDLDAIYDRASLIALNPELRKKYYEVAKNLLAANKQILLITLEYDQSLISGPPFCVEFKEVYDHIGEFFDFATLDEEETETKGRKFQDAGLKACQRKVYHLKKY